MVEAMFRRVRVPLLLAVVTAFAVTLIASPDERAVGAESDADLAQIACSLPREYLLRTWRGWRPDRGAQISFIAKEPDFVGSGLPHVGPWPYIQDVPMFWYGPGFIQARGEVDRPVTVAGIAPTAAELLKFDGFTAPDGQPMTEALEGGVTTSPKLIVTMVWDAGGINVLESHPDSWPYLKSLIPEGTWFTDATVGSSPSSTAQIHATIGTGAFPNHHGIVGHTMRIGAKLTSPWSQGPTFLIEPTLADVYDRAMDNEPIAGIVATVDIHFGMLGHGAFFSGGDQDIAVTRSVIDGETLTDEGFEWNLPEREAGYYRLAEYANDVPGFEADVEAVDRADGKLDGKWRDNEIEPLLQGFDTPARTPYQERVVEEIIRREGFGADDVPDLLYLNFKEIDYISHVWSVNSPEMRDAVVEQDRALRRLVKTLNHDVGRGEWVLAITADHGSMPDPGVSGAYQISTAPMQIMINERFDDGDDVPVVELMQPTQVFIDEAELAEVGATLGDVSRFMMTFTQLQTEGSGVTAQPGKENETVMAAVFPSALMQDMACLPEAVPE